MSGALLDEIIGRLTALPADEREKTIADAVRATAAMVWCPNPGPQLAAYNCQADELFYGGEPGGGKTDLLCGLGLTAHRQSLILRRTNKEANGLVDVVQRILGHRHGWNSQENIWRLDAVRALELGGCQLEDDKQKYKGKPKDLIGFDEVSDFTESQYKFIIIWNRSTVPGQRCRVVAAGNPPTRPQGLWVLRRWGAWLDAKHPDPAADGELRWYTSDEDGNEIEVEGPGPHLIAGKPVMARSRTFIRAKLADNPDLHRSGYQSQLDATTGLLRRAYHDADFGAAAFDAPNQCIPTAWVLAAQRRWTDKPPAGVPMCAIGVDASGGGDDPLVLAPRHDGWFAPLIVVPGSEIPADRIGRFCAGIVVSHRKHSATIVVDMGGGYGGPIYEHLKENSVELLAWKGAEKANARTRDRKLGFANKRSQAIWQFREALDPSQDGGSPIALPDDAELRADLTAPTFDVTPNGIRVESKEDVCDRLGRSTDRGDAAVMAWQGGQKIGNVPGGWYGDPEEHGASFRPGFKRQPKVVMGRDAARRRMS